MMEMLLEDGDVAEDEAAKDEDEAAEALEAAEEDARERKLSRSKYVSNEQLEFMKECKARVEKMSLEACQARYDRTFDGAVIWVERPRMARNATPAAAQVRGVGVWWPSKMYACMEGRICCPMCAKAGVKRSAAYDSGKWAQQAREIVGARSTWFLLCRLYRCRGCNREFRNLRDDVLRSCPDAVRLNFGVLTRKRLAIEREVALVLYSSWLLSPATALSDFREAHIRHYEDVKRQYVAVQGLGGAGATARSLPQGMGMRGGVPNPMDPEIARLAEMAGLESPTHLEAQRELAAEDLLRLTLQESLPHLRSFGKDKLRFFNKSMGFNYVYELDQLLQEPMTNENVRKWTGDKTQKPARLRRKVQNWKAVVTKFFEPRLAAAGFASVGEVLSVRQRKVERSARNLAKIKDLEARGALSTSSGSAQGAPSSASPSQGTAPPPSLAQSGLPASSASQSQLSSTTSSGLVHASAENNGPGLPASSSDLALPAAAGGAMLQGVPPFGSFGDPEGYNGYLIGRKFLDDIGHELSREVPSLRDLDRHRLVQSGFSDEQREGLRSLAQKLSRYEELDSDAPPRPVAADGDDGDPPLGTHAELGAGFGPSEDSAQGLDPVSTDADANGDAGGASAGLAGDQPVSRESDSDVRADTSEVLPEPSKYAILERLYVSGSSRVPRDSMAMDPSEMEKLERTPANPDEPWRTLENLNPRKYCQGCHRPRQGHNALSKRLMPGVECPSGVFCVLPKSTPDISKLPIEHFFSGSQRRREHLQHMHIAQSGQRSEDSDSPAAKRRRGEDESSFAEAEGDDEDAGEAGLADNVNISADVGNMHTDHMEGAANEMGSGPPKDISAS